MAKPGKKPNTLVPIKENIKKYSQNESRSILIAFLIQLVIFFIIQFFEIGFEIGQKRKRQ